MDHKARGVFHVNVSRECRSSNGSSSGNSSSSKRSSNESLSRSTDSSSAPQVVESSSPSTGIYEPADDAESSSTWGIHEMASRVEQEHEEEEQQQQKEEEEKRQKEKEEEEQQQQQQQPLLSTPCTSPPLSLRGDSSSVIVSGQHSPPRVRPTSELPPTKSVGDVPHSAPTAVKPGEKICHDNRLSFESPMQSQISSHPPVFPSSTSDPLVTSSIASPYPSPTPKITRPTTTERVTDIQNSLQGAQCTVCSLCGVTVLQMGTFEEQEKQYREHVESWVHQKNDEMRTLLERGGRGFSTKKSVGDNTSISPTKLKSFDELAISPIKFTSKNVKHVKTSTLRENYAHFLREGTRTEVVKPIVSPPLTFSPILHSREGTTSHVQKELFCEHSHQSVPGNEEETRYCTCENDPVTVKEKVKPRVEPDNEKHLLPNQGAGSRKNSDDAHSKKQSHEISSSSGMFPNNDISNEDLLKKERQMERKLDKYMIKKERYQLLLCFRRWFNLMFVRVMDNSSPLRVRADLREQMKKKFEGQNVPSSGSETTESHRSADSATPKQPVEGQEKKSELRRPSKTTTTTTARTEPFMETHVREFSCVNEGSSSDNLKDKECTTDVSWYIHPASHRKNTSKKVEKRRGSQTSPLMDEKSVADILATLSPSLRERVGTLFQTETPHSSTFPKASCALSQLHSSAIPPQSSSWTSFNVGGSHRSSSGAPIPCSIPTGLEVAADVRERNREEEQGDVKEEKVKGHNQHEEPRSQHHNHHHHHHHHHHQKHEEYQTYSASQGEAMRAKDLSAAGILPRNSATSSSNQKEVHQLRKEADQREENGQPKVPGVAEDVKHATTRMIDRSNRNPFAYENDNHPSGNQGEYGRGQGERIFIDKRRQWRPHSPSPRHPGGLECGRGTSFGVNSSMRGRGAQTPMMGRREKEERHPSILKNKDALNHGSKSEKFRGIPGEYYIYYKGSYHHLRDPASEIHYDVNGRRMPIYFVRRSMSPSVSPMRGRWFSLTRPRSPLGPSRLNPYCAVCVARYNLVLVDESMQPLRNSPQRLPHTRNDGVNTSHCCRTRSGRRSTPAKTVPRHTTPCSFSEELGPWNRVSKLQAHNCQHFSPASMGNPRRSNSQRIIPVYSTSQRVSEPSSATPSPPQRRVDAEMQRSRHDKSNTLRNFSPEEESWLMRQERRLRRRMKSLIWRELPQRRGGREWKEYLSSLNEVVQMLETLREGENLDR
ncbi:megakaryocyte stimulating factor [Trypanosoma theileri]|uniref:Megakaryocyte stimulating factor n=1 Tax=Trypanosoma theileri TaxID=67003 RepID=A0A1X0NZI7_9TRYP|nr:megakaryocyte stimulating factor [Trypanosoma theileri]ORC90107.1 megakaryocyte stimulating factor [Trypanosoma theileri]